MRRGPVIAALAFALTTRAAAAQTPAECVAATERGQSKRDDGQLLASRTEFLACASDACPAVVRRECVRWLAEVDARLPSIVMSVVDSNGHDVSGAEVSIDGVVRPGAGLGHAFSLDPGTHTVRVMGISVDPVTEPIVVREREQQRVVKVVLHSRAVPPPNDIPEKRGPAVPVAAVILGGVAVVGAASFAYYWAHGTSKVSDLRASCAPYCSADQIGDARTMLDVARVSGGIALAAAVGALAVFLLTPRSTARPTGPASLVF